MSLDTATGPQSRPAQRRDRALLPLLALGNFVIGLGAFVVIGVLVPIADSLGVSKAEAGRLMTVYAIAYALASPLLAALTGRLPRRTILVIGMGLFLAGALLSAVAPSLKLLMLARVLAAAGAGLFTPSAAAVAVAVSAPSGRARALSFVFAGFTVAQVLGVPAGSWIGYTFGWQAAFWVVAALASLSALGLALWVPGDVRFQPTSLATLGRTLIDPVTGSGILFTAILLGAVYVVYTYYGPVLDLRLGLGRDGITLFLLIYGFGAFLGNIVGGFLTERIGANKTLAMITAAQIVLMPLITLLPYGPVAGAALAFTWSVCGWSFMAPQQLRLVGLAPQATGVVLALNASAIYIGAAIGSAVGGAVIADTGDLRLLGLAGAAIGLVAAGNLAVSVVLARRAGRLG